MGAEKTWCVDVDCATGPGRGCMPMCRTMSVLVRGTVKSFKLLCSSRLGTQSAALHLCV